MILDIFLLHGVKTAYQIVLVVGERERTRHHEHMGKSFMSSGDTQTLDTCQPQLTLSHLSVSFPLTLPSATQISTRSCSAVNPDIQGSTWRKKTTEHYTCTMTRNFIFSPLCDSKFFYFSIHLNHPHTKQIYCNKLSMLWTSIIQVSQQCVMLTVSWSSLTYCWVSLQRACLGVPAFKPVTAAERLTQPWM